MDDVDDGPEFISPPFSVVFLTVTKVIVSALIVVGALAIIGLVVVLVIAALGFALD